MLLVTSDVEEGHDLLRGLYADHTPRLSGDPKEYRFRYAVNSLDGLGVDDLRHSLTVETDVEPYHLLQVVDIRQGRMAIDAGGAADRCGPDDLLLVDPLRPISVAMTNLDLTAVRLDLAAVRRVAADMTGVDAEHVDFDMSRPVGPSHARYWRAAVDHIRRDVLADDEIADQPLMRSEAFRELATALLIVFPSTARQALSDRPAGRSRGADPAVLRRAMGFIDDNAHRAIGTADIAEAARIGVRGLQALFARHRDQTPQGYLREVRMSHAHHELQAADPTRGDTVSGVAARWGFTNAGRFSVEYRRRYGCPPSQTLRG